MKPWQSANLTMTSILLYAIAFVIMSSHDVPIWHRFAIVSLVAAATAINCERAR